MRHGAASTNPTARRWRLFQRADLSLLILLVALTWLAFGVERWWGERLTPFWLFWAGVVMSLGPAGIWLFFFYRRDRHNPEPAARLLQVFTLGALLAAAVGIPLLTDVFAVETWLWSNWPWSYLAGSFLVVGFTQEFLKYAAVRFSVFQAPIFNELTDGIFYATTAGLGYATVLNIQFVVEAGGVGLGLTAIQITVNALAHASFAGVMGFFLGRERFSRRPVWWMPAGVALAALLNAVFFFLRTLLSLGDVTPSGNPANTWVGLALAALFALGLLWLLTRWLEQDQPEPPTRPAPASGGAT